MADGKGLSGFQERLFVCASRGNRATYDAPRGISRTQRQLRLQFPPNMRGLGGATDYETSPDATLIVSASGIIVARTPRHSPCSATHAMQLVGCALDCRCRSDCAIATARTSSTTFADPTPDTWRCPRSFWRSVKTAASSTWTSAWARSKRRMGRAPSPYYGRILPPAWSGRCAKRLDFEALVTDITADVVVATPESIRRCAAQRPGTASQRGQRGSRGLPGIQRRLDVGDAHPRRVRKRNPEDSREDRRPKSLPLTDGHLRAGKTVCIPDVSDLPEEAAIDQGNWKALATAALLIIPVFPADGFRHAIIVDRSSDACAWPIDLGARMRLLGEIMVDALMRNRHITQLARAHEELKAIKVRLESENLYLRETLVPKGNLNGIVATSPGMTHVMELVTRVAPTESTVLLLGETGTGKELLARAIHRLSRRKDRLLIAVNCAALPASLVESELFGREKGAYTGALARQAGRFEVADGPCSSSTKSVSCLSTFKLSSCG